MSSHPGRQFSDSLISGNHTATTARVLRGQSRGMLRKVRLLASLERHLVNNLQGVWLVCQRCCQVALCMVMLGQQGSLTADITVVGSSFAFP